MCYHACNNRQLLYDVAGSSHCDKQGVAFRLRDLSLNLLPNRLQSARKGV
ncbi:hypothetical protein DFP86_110151 [Paludibacterium purpuratum]|uniref:Uncharacterized protein n=1 Tax=Paludibacterium purpuratum TaxID=1144873 RepID=A0A4R7B3X1_9NEIS|nr:hypothetical protein DFP86_110151 [Paludibacterium purpuratum]